MIIGDEYFYSLRDVIFFLENAHLTLAEYRRKAVENKISAIVEQDRMPLQKYLTGKGPIPSLLAPADAL